MSVSFTSKWSRTRIFQLAKVCSDFHSRTNPAITQHRSCFRPRPKYQSHSFWSFLQYWYRRFLLVLGWKHVKLRITNVWSNLSRFESRFRCYYQVRLEAFSRDGPNRRVVTDFLYYNFDIISFNKFRIDHAQNLNFANPTLAVQILNVSIWNGFMSSLEASLDIDQNTRCVHIVVSCNFCIESFYQECLD
jgi:hypothetical protein